MFPEKFELSDPALPGRIVSVYERVFILAEVIRQGYLPGHISPEADASLRVRYHEAASEFAQQAMTVLAHPVIAGRILEGDEYDSTHLTAPGCRYTGITPDGLRSNPLLQTMSFGRKDRVFGFQFQIRTAIYQPLATDALHESKYAVFCDFVESTYPSPSSNKWQFSLGKGLSWQELAQAARDLEPTDLAEDPGLMVCFISWADRRISRLIQQLGQETMRQEDVGILERLVKAFEGAQSAHSVILEELPLAALILPEPGPRA